MNEDEGLGMNLFLGEEFYQENDADNTPEQDEEIIQEEHVEDIPDEVDEDTEANDEPKEGDNSSSPSLYQSLATSLLSEGVLASVDSSKVKAANSWQDIADLIVEEAKAKELADLNPLQKEAVQAMRDGISPETFRKQKQAELELDSISDSHIENDEELRKEIIFQSFINKGFPEDKATKLTNRSFEAGEDIQDAKEALTDIRTDVKERFKQQQEYEKTQKLEADKKKAKEREDIEKTILKTEDFNGVTLNEVSRKKILETMLVPVGKNPTTGEEENALMKDQRENKDFAKNLYTVYALTKGFTDFTVFGKKEVKKTVNALEKALKSNQHILNGGDPSFIDDPNASDYDIGEKLVF